jgi:Flp pilus assembly protein TadD
MVKWIYWSLVIQLIVGCSSLLVKTPSDALSPEMLTILSGRPILGRELEESELPNEDLFSLTADMKSFAEQATRNRQGLYDRVKALHVALLSSQQIGGHGLVYSTYSTETPRVSFATRRANCLSFTLLYVAMARHLGINAYINEVEIPPTWDLRNQKNMVFFRHVNVRIPIYGSGLNVKALDPATQDGVVIDLEMDRYSPSYNQREIDDQMASAEFYNNRAIEFLEVENYEQSFINLRKAIELDANQSYIWSNLAALLSRKRLLKESELVYLHGLKLNPNDLTIISNLGYLYAQMGNEQESLRYKKLAHIYRQSNPYLFYGMALAAYSVGEYGEAQERIQKAISLERKDARFYELAEKIFIALGETSSAERMRFKIAKLKR